MDVFFDVLSAEILSKRPYGIENIATCISCSFLIDTCLMKIPSINLTTITRDSELLQLMKDHISVSNNNQNNNESITTNSNHIKFDQQIPLVEESRILMADINDYLQLQIYYSTHINRDPRSSEDKLKDEAKSQAMMNELLIASDGTYLELSLYHRYIYGESINRLIAKLTQARVNADKAKMRCLDSMGVGQYYKDVNLMHSFIEGELTRNIENIDSL